MQDFDSSEMPNRPDNHEAAMARADLYKCANYSFKLFKMIQDGQELEGWVQAKITKAADYIASVYHYMEYEMKFNDYGKRLEDSDIYTESVKQEFVKKLTEARVKMEKLKEKNIKDLAQDKAEEDKPVKESAKKSSKLNFLTVDKDGGKKEPMKKAAKEVNEGIKDIVKGATRLIKGKPSKGEVATKHELKSLGAAHAALDSDDRKSYKSSMKTAEKEASRAKKIRSLPRKEVDEASTGSYSAKDARASKDPNKPGKQLSKAAAKAGNEYGSKERGQKVAGARPADPRKK